MMRLWAGTVAEGGAGAIELEVIEEVVEEEEGDEENEEDGEEARDEEGSDGACSATADSERASDSDGGDESTYVVRLDVAAIPSRRDREAPRSRPASAAAKARGGAPASKERRARHLRWPPRRDSALERASRAGSLVGGSLHRPHGAKGADAALLQPELVPGRLLRRRPRRKVVGIRVRERSGLPLGEHLRQGLASTRPLMRDLRGPRPGAPRRARRREGRRADGPCQRACARWC